MNLLLRFYDLEAGRITLDGTDIATLEQDSLRSQIGVVTQDTSLLHRSIRDNIAYGRPDASDAEIIAAAKRANAWDFIETLEDQKGRRGLDAQVGERGVKLSGGQRQRIAIARVFLKDAPELILYEAAPRRWTRKSRSRDRENLFALMQGKTVIAIATPLRPLTEMDRLVVLEQGAIAETGSHGELLTQAGSMPASGQRQSGGFLADEDGEAPDSEQGGGVGGLISPQGKRTSRTLSAVILGPVPRICYGRRFCCNPQLLGFVSRWSGQARP